MHAYCLFCETQKCANIATLIEQNLGIRCISPQIIQRKWVKGACEEKHHPWLPGYIFLYIEEPLTDIPRYPGILRRLGDGELQGTDKAFAEMLLDCNGVMGIIQLVETGQRCMISDPVWQQIEGKVIKIDRGRKRCCVDFIFDSVRRSIWLGYEMVQPILVEKTTGK